jgi:hypothetical protein
MSQNGKMAQCRPQLGSSSIAEALGNERPAIGEEIRIGDLEEEKRKLKEKEDTLRREPLTVDAHTILQQRVPGSHARINFLPPFRLAPFAVAMGHPIEPGEIDFFVGPDGEINSATCARKVEEHPEKTREEIFRRKALLKIELERADKLPYSEEEKGEAKKLLTDEAEAQIAKLERELELDSPPNCRFTPMFWVDPNINFWLLGELKRNGGNVRQAFTVGDSKLEIIRSGCFYTINNGKTFALSGSPWYSDMRNRGEVRLARTPLGEMAVLHPKAGNTEDTINAFLSGGRRAREACPPRWYWGISQIERRRRAALKEQEQALATPTPDFIDRRGFIERLLAD